MSSPIAACCVVVLTQQQQQNTTHCTQSAEDAWVNQDKLKPKNCTIVENGRVIVTSTKK